MKSVATLAGLTLAQRSELLSMARARDLARRGSELPPIEPAARDGRVPLSFAQQRLWFVEQLGDLGSTYHISRRLRLRGELDRVALVRALDRIVARHEALRTTFAQVDGVPEQRIAPADAGFHLVEHDLTGRAGADAALEAMRPEALGEQRLTVESCDNRQGDMREWLQGRIDAEDKRLVRLRDGIHDATRRYKNDWPVETSEVDVSVDAAGEYRVMLEQLRADDLPGFEKRFKELLNENTIREVANFQAQLNRERIETINGSLGQIDYNPGRYIALLAEPAQDVEVRDFVASLRACTEGALTGSDDEQYSEAKFLQVKAIIERFRGREGQTELDQRWTRKVTDVRNGFVFSASERWREDDSEYEHYTDSGGKSGGQKESSRTRCSPPAWPTSSAWSGASRARARSASW